MKKYIKYILLLCAVLSAFSLSAMEEGEGKEEGNGCYVGSFQELPPELHYYMLQFLGNTTIETINNIISLSQVDKYFNSLIKTHFESISAMLQKKFAGNIKRTFNAALTTDNYKTIGKLLKFNLITIESALEAAMVELKPDLINYLYEHNLINNDTRILFQYDLLTPVGFIINEMSFIDTESGVYILEAMVSNGAEIDNYNDEITTLYAALRKNTYFLFDTLLELGADPLKANADGTSVIQYLNDIPEEDRYGSFPYFAYQNLINQYKFTKQYAMNRPRGHMRTALSSEKPMRHGYFKRVSRL